MRTPHDFTTMKIWTETLRRLKLVAALSGESVVALLDRLSRDELAFQEQRRKEREKDNA